MSVPKSKRTHGKLEALTQARHLKTYTLQICTNEKNFPKRYRWCVTNNIVQEVVEICRLIVGANAIKVENEFDARRRLEKQNWNTANYAQCEVSRVLVQTYPVGQSGYETFTKESEQREGKASQNGWCAIQKTPWRMLQKLA